jgi:glycosyltransferase involved in cell wall biosynthesis
MKTKKLSVTIGIPAFNEESNIGNLISSLIAQRQIGFNLDNIIISSDGSTDRTPIIVKKFKNYGVELIANPERLGKPARINQIFSLSKSDVTVILDADITISSLETISTLVSPFSNNLQLMLVSGNAQPASRRNFIQRSAYAGIQLWHLARELTSKTDMYYCEGTIRAFRKQLYNELIFPSVSADDVFPYIFCYQKGYQFQYVKDAIIYYNLPATYKDFVKQYSRSLLSMSIQQKNFNLEIVTELYSIGVKEKLKALAYQLIKSPFFTLCYLLFLIEPKIKARKTNFNRSARWEIVSSTKK